MDFRDAVYYPVVAFLAHENPYDRPRFLDKYPAAEGIGLYSPVTLLLHLPFGFLPFRAAELSYYAISIVLSIGLGAVALTLCRVPLTAARVMGVGAFVVLSRPGQWNLLLGQVTLQAALLAYVALWYARERPLLAGVALALLTFKPTYALPLGLLMFAQGDSRAVLCGLTVAAALSALAVGPIVSAVGLDDFISSVAASYGPRVATLSAAVSPFRVDVVALVTRLVGWSPNVVETLALGGVVLTLGAVGLRRLAGRTDRAARVLSLGLASMSILLCAYHQQYDLVLLLPPLVSLLASEEPWAAAPRIRLLAIGLLGLPFVNYFSSGTAAINLGMAPGWLAAASAADSVAVLLAFGLWATAAVHVAAPADDIAPAWGPRSPH